MTPAARIQTATELLDDILAGQPAEQVLTRWARASRFAGSGDRAALRDLVFDALRRMRSYGALGGALTGRGLMLGALRAAGQDVDAVFSGVGYGPAPVSDAERAAFGSPDAAEARDLPDWLWPEFLRSLGDGADQEALLLRDRADVFLRVNLRAGSVDAACASLAGDAIETEPCNLAATALRVIGGARRIARSTAYTTGLVELQDAASQAVVDRLPLRPGDRVLDYCAGGGGKALAMAARTGGTIVAHDADPARMADIAPRARRAGADILCTDTVDGVFDLVLCDAPCSGSGSWRRAPEAKWRLTRDRLEGLQRLQDQILDTAARHVAPGGRLAYATCSFLCCENADRAEEFLRRRPGWSLVDAHRFALSDGADGFYVAQFMRD